jgi:hypothetical protein
VSLDDRIDTFVLQEFRLHAAEGAHDAARIVSAFSKGRENAVPLMTSIDDLRDVATVRALHPGETADGDPDERAALEPLVASWRPSKKYGPRIAEHAVSPPTYYRLAVTESGINNADPDPDATVPRQLNDASSSAQLGLLWIGLPLGTHAGLLTLVGSNGDGHAMRPDPRVWPLPFSRPLGVRIYETRG